MYNFLIKSIVLGLGVGVGLTVVWTTLSAIVNLSEKIHLWWEYDRKRLLKKWHK